jgi:hypothetical protein
MQCPSLGSHGGYALETCWQLDSTSLQSTHLVVKRGIPSDSPNSCSRGPYERFEISNMVLGNCSGILHSKGTIGCVLRLQYVSLVASFPMIEYASYWMVHLVEPCGRKQALPVKLSTSFVHKTILDDTRYPNATAAWKYDSVLLLGSFSALDLVATAFNGVFG